MVQHITERIKFSAITVPPWVGNTLQLPNILSEGSEELLWYMCNYCDFRNIGKFISLLLYLSDYE